MVSAAAAATSASGAAKHAAASAAGRSAFMTGGQKPAPVAPGTGPRGHDTPSRGGSLTRATSMMALQTAASYRAPVAAGLAAFVGVVSALFEEDPYAMSFAVCFVKGIAADAVSQQLSGVTFVFRRCLAFGIYAGAYQGCVQNFIINHVFTQLLGAGTSLKEVASKVVVENFVHAPLMCLPAYYIVKAMVFGTSPTVGLQEYIWDVKEQGVLQRYWVVWIPTQFFTFSMVPEHLRIAFIALVSFFWLMILSTTNAAGESKRSQPAKTDGGALKEET